MLYFFVAFILTVISPISFASSVHEHVGARHLIGADYSTYYDAMKYVVEIEFGELVSREVNTSKQVVREVIIKKQYKGDKLQLKYLAFVPNYEFKIKKKKSYLLHLSSKNDNKIQASIYDQEKPYYDYLLNPIKHQEVVNFYIQRHDINYLHSTKNTYVLPIIIGTTVCLLVFCAVKLLKIKK